MVKYLPTLCWKRKFHIFPHWRSNSQTGKMFTKGHMWPRKTTGIETLKASGAAKLLPQFSLSLLLHSAWIRSELCHFLVEFVEGLVVRTKHCYLRLQPAVKGLDNKSGCLVACTCVSFVTPSTAVTYFISVLREIWSSAYERGRTDHLYYPGCKICCVFRLH